MIKKLKQLSPEILMFFILISAVALGNGLSNNVYSNYYKEVYDVTALQRGFIEFPRELPGMLCVLVISFLSFLGDLRIALIAQVLAIIGVAVLGLFTPSFTVMLIFLFINSMGMHLFMPLQDAIGMSLANPNQVGRRMGQFSSARAAFGLLAALLVFFGFRTDFFSFNTSIKWIFVVSAVAFTCAAVMSVIMIRRTKPHKVAARKIKLIFRKEYRYFYLITVLRGVQKQIAIVYGTWVLVDVLMKKADTIAMLSMIAGFISIFFLNKLGNWMDQFGIKRMLYLDALTFIGVYLGFGFVVWGITTKIIPSHSLGLWMIYILFILDKLSFRMGMIKAVYLRSIAWSEEEITSTLSLGLSLDHVVSILAAFAGGYVWSQWGSQWVFFLAALFSLGNLFVAYRVQPDQERDLAERMKVELKETGAGV